MAKLCFYLFLSTGFLNAATDPEWESALSVLNAGQAAEAIPLFQNWIAKQEAAGVQSAEAQHNLALAYLRDNQPGKATYPLANSALLRLDPLYSWQTAENLSRIQHKILIQEAVSSQWQFRLSLLLRPGWIWLVGTLGAWMILFSLFAGSLRGLGVALGLSCLVLSGAGFAVRATLPRFGVVTETASLNSDPVLGVDKRLTDLPAGTLVVLGKTQDHTISVSAPFAGWLPTRSVQLLAK